MRIYHHRTADAAICAADEANADTIRAALAAIAAEVRALLADLAMLHPIARRFGCDFNAAVDDRQLRLYALRQTRAQFRTHVGA